MSRCSPLLPEQAWLAANLLTDLFGPALEAVYLHGSGAGCGLRPQSDIDLLAVIGRPLTETERAGLIASLLRLSGRHPASADGPRCIEVMIFLEAEVVRPSFPARAEFIYGEWLRGELEAPLAATACDVTGPSLPDPEHTLVLAQARGEALPLLGPPPEKLLPEISPAHVRAAMRETLPALLGSLKGDERNVLLTLARMWRTAAIGDFVSKDAAAQWAAPQMPSSEAETLRRAQEAYLGMVEDDWSGSHERHAAQQTAAYLERRLQSLL